jgi:hypothetical protein
MEIDLDANGKIVFIWVFYKKYLNEY